MMFEPIQYIAAAVVIFVAPSAYDAARRYIASRRASPYSKPVSRNEADKVRLWHMQSELEEREKQVAAREQQQESLEGKLASASAELEAANRKNAKANEDLAQLGVAYADARGTISTMTGKLSSCEGSLAEKTAQLEAKEAQQAAALPETAGIPGMDEPSPQPEAHAPQEPSVALEDGTETAEAGALRVLAKLEAEEQPIIAGQLAAEVGWSPKGAAEFLKREGYEHAGRITLPDGSQPNIWKKPDASSSVIQQEPATSGKNAASSSSEEGEEDAGITN